MVEDGFRGWGPRLAAPIAFFLAATILIVLVHSALSNGDSPAVATTPTATKPAETTQSVTATTEDQRPKRRKRRFYVVQSGDTFALIAEQFDTTVAALETLNPEVDPSALTVGERVRVR